MSGTSLKRGATPPRQKPRPATVTLPVAAAKLRRRVAITVAGLVGVTTVIVAAIAGVPQRLGQEAVRATARAGLEIVHVDITGNKETSRLDIIRKALPGRDNAMLTSNLGAIRADLLALPWVADASVGRRLPDTLAIHIVERRPVAIWQHDKLFNAIDITGKPLTNERLTRFSGLPRIIGRNANLRVREMLALTAVAPTLEPHVSSMVLVGGRRWDVKFKTGETLSLPDTPAAASAALHRFANLEAGLGPDRKLLGGRFERFDMRLPGQMIVGGPAVEKALEAAARDAKQMKPTTI
ncbi:MAG: hypothetical protein RL490_1205 [Pseudomonadota bacterium]|jgi:cell division protein FtsQ